MKVITLPLLLIIFLVTELHAQIAPNEKEILLNVFREEKVYHNASSQMSRSRHLIYLYLNEVLISHIENYEDSVGRKISDELGGMALFCSDEKTDIRVFGDPIRVNAVTNYAIDLAVVIKRFKVSKNGVANLTFETTNLRSKKWKKNSDIKFYRFNCLFKMEAGHWTLSKIDTKEKSFKEIKT